MPFSGTCEPGSEGHQNETQNCNPNPEKDELEDLC
jgi:hypothetical protein